MVRYCLLWKEITGSFMADVFVNCTAEVKGAATGESLEKLNSRSRAFGFFLFVFPKFRIPLQSKGAL